MESTNILPDFPIETHPFEPFIPPGAKILIMGTFPPQPKRWSMDFYYPNRTNDFWPMMALIFRNDKNALYDETGKFFDIVKIKNLLNEYKIAMSDTGYRIQRLKDNASDKFLNIIEANDLSNLMKLMPECRAIATTGEKAADIIAELTATIPPKMGNFVKVNDRLTHWRMPSTSRAYPLKLEKKADFYAKMFKTEGIIIPE